MSQNASATLILPPELGVCIYCLKTKTSASVYQNTAFASLYLLHHGCLLLHSCRYLLYMQLSKHLPGTYITDTKKETTMSSGSQGAMPG